MIDHLVLFAVREDASPEDAEDLLSSARALREQVPGIVDLSAGKNFSERAKGYTHGLFARSGPRMTSSPTWSTRITNPSSRSWTR